MAKKSAVVKEVAAPVAPKKSPVPKAKYLYRTDLVRNHACDEQINKFNELFPSGKVAINQKNVLKYAKFFKFNWAVINLVNDADAHQEKQNAYNDESNKCREVWDGVVEGKWTHEMAQEKVNKLELQYQKTCALIFNKYFKELPKRDGDA